MPKKSDGFKLVAENLYRDPKTKLYWAKVKINNKRKQENLMTTSKSKAMMLRNEWLNKLRANGPSAAHRDLTLDEVFEKFVQSRATKSAKRSNRAWAKICLKGCSWKEGSRIPFDRITTSQIEFMLESAFNRRSEENGKPYSDSTIYGCQNFLKTSLRWGLENAIGSMILLPA